MMVLMILAHTDKSRINCCVVQYTNHLWSEMSNTPTYMQYIYSQRSNSLKAGYIINIKSPMQRALDVLHSLYISVSQSEATPQQAESEVKDQLTRLRLVRGNTEGPPECNKRQMNPKWARAEDKKAKLGQDYKEHKAEAGTCSALTNKKGKHKSRVKNTR